MMTLEVSLDMNNDEMIHVPYLRVQYRERTSTYIEQNNSKALVEFGTYYSSSTVDWWKTAEAIFYVLLVVLILILVIKAFVYVKKPQLSRNQDRSRQVCFDVIRDLLDFFSTIYFWYLFFMIGYWFVFFKLQERVYCFLPTHKTYWENFE